MKKKWEKPSVQIIVRSTPEEAVLGGCKKEMTGGPVLLGCIEPPTSYCREYPAS